MRIFGRRADGVWLIGIGSRQVVLLAADLMRASSPFDELDADRYGHFHDEALGPHGRQLIAKRLLAARAVDPQAFRLYNEDEARDDHGRWTSGGAGEALVSRMAVPDGGFTYQVTTGGEPTSGYAVSILKEQTVMKASDVTPSRLLGFVKDHWDALKESGNFLGAWHNPDDGQVYLDVSTVVKTREEADRIGRENSQIAYFRLHEGKSYPVEKGASHG